ncbi:protease pro-enzyme activation domain-containing protein [Rhodanobacter sp. L36]|uniref:protease pro-enzyme activation domain-containing protein n=1 Tax=Rhodanobacter sp. L36 TaxID=1747221 RepID=UPI00131E158F|nr:protease pro-enzyme activation domain-containing protein [Rhodanobacter sp. L36]
MAFTGMLSSATHAAQATSIPDFTPDTARITGAIDNTKLFTVPGSKPALAVASQDTGALPQVRTIRNVTLLLKRSATKQAQFENYLAQLTTPSSPYFHHWLTAKQVGTMFGPATADIGKVAQWLQSQGLHLDGVSPTGMSITFSGTSAAVGNAFHTTLHGFTVHGEQHFANASVQQIPVALAPVVSGVASLNNFFPKPQHADVGTVTRDKRSGRWKTVSRAKGAPQITLPPGTIDTATTYDVAPPDFNTVYNVGPLWNRSTPIRGAGQTVAVLERTDVLPADVQTFRGAFLPASAIGAVSYINPQQNADDTSCADPGRNGDEGEAALDAEWIGAAAPDANVVFASCDDSQSATFGPFIAAQNLLSGYVAPMPTVFSLSYGECEAAGFVDGMVEEAGDLWSQAAAEGVTVFVSTGDAGSASCDQNGSAASQGITVNGLASTPYNVAVGGTDFNDYNNTAPYWSQSNTTLYGSALSYIPEQTWDTSCASDTLDAVLGFSNGVDACNTPAGQRFLNTGGGGGGASNNWFQPLWQVGIYGSTNVGARMIPDVSLFAANGLYGHSLVYCMSDADEGGTHCDYTDPDSVYFNSAGGTSFAAPAMAGVQALINQASGTPSGNILPALYNLGTKEYGTSHSPNTAMLTACSSSNGTQVDAKCIFNNVTVGTIDEPCFGGTNDCYNGKSSKAYGVLSAGGIDQLDPAWSTNAGYSLATGLGSINASNLVDALNTFYAPFKNGYVAPSDYLSSANESQGDGYSDIAVLEPVNASFLQLGMKGSIALNNIAQPMPAGYAISAVGNFFTPAGTIFNRDIDSIALTGPGNQLYVMLSDGLGGAANYYESTAIGDPYPAGWSIAGAAAFDSAGTDELFLANPQTGQVQWQQLGFTLFYILGKAHYTFHATSSPVYNGPAGFVPHLADVNGDGFADIVWTGPNAANNTVYLSINNQRGSFDTTQIADRPAGFTLFGAGDVAGHGVTSLFWTNPTAHALTLWTMDGATIASQQTLPVPTGYTLASIADYDGDGLADILWSSRAQFGSIALGPAMLYEWLSNGSGGFSSQAVADLDGKQMTVPAGALIQANRLQGGRVTSGIDTSTGVSH